MRRVLITGANGFVGRWACRTFQERGWEVFAAVRRTAAAAGLGAHHVIPAADLALERWPGIPRSLDSVVHLAARAHRLGERQSAALPRFRAVNVAGTLRLAEAARAAGAHQFIMVSSVKAMGEERNAAYTESDLPRPRSAYGLSKLEAEWAAAERLAGSGTALTVLRPAMIYGPGGKGNVPLLLALARLGQVIPLPLGSVRNRRSALFVGNFADLLERCAASQEARGETFLVSDGDDFSTPELLARLGLAMGKPVHLFGVPPPVLLAGARLLGRREVAARLLGSLWVDTTRVEKRLGWVPPYDLDHGLVETVRAG